MTIYNTFNVAVEASHRMVFKRHCVEKRHRATVIVTFVVWYSCQVNRYTRHRLHQVRYLDARNDQNCWTIAVCLGSVAELVHCVQCRHNET